MELRPVWIAFQRYNFSVSVVAVVAVVAAVAGFKVVVVAVVAVFNVIYSKTMANGQLPLLKSCPNWP